VIKDNRDEFLTSACRIRGGLFFSGKVHTVEVSPMRKTLMMLGLLALSLLAVPVRSDESPVAPSDEQAIRQAINAYSDALNKADLDALMAVWAPRAEYIDEKHVITKGRTAIRELFKHHLAGLKGAKISFKVTSLRELTPDVILQDGTSKLTLADGHVDDGHFAAVWARKDGKWLLHSVRELHGAAGAPAVAGGALKELQWMVGDWKADKEGIDISVRWTLDQVFLLQDYKVGKGDSALEVKQLIGFDPLTGQIKSWTFDSLGGYGEGLWTREGNSWFIETAGVLPGGQTGSGVNVIHYEDDQHFVFQSNRREVEGQPLTDSEVKLVRKVPTR
jgi:uncharacterized protein (TIGR02246 family)